MNSELIYALNQAFCDNFLLYFRSHVAHVNITGRNFYSDHRILGKIYEDAQANIDVYAEHLRSAYSSMPTSLQEIIDCGNLRPQMLANNADEYLTDIYADIEHMIECLQELSEAAREAEAQDVANFADARIEHHRKQCWQLRATLEMEE